MGIYNSVWFKCPHCSEAQEEQFKPGIMQSWEFPKDAKNMPVDYVGSFQEAEHTCWSCERVFFTDVHIELRISDPRILKERP